MKHRKIFIALSIIGIISLSASVYADLNLAYGNCLYGEGLFGRDERICGFPFVPQPLIQIVNRITNVDEPFWIYGQQAFLVIFFLTIGVFFVSKKKPEMDKDDD